MAGITFSPIVVAASGSAGPVVFSRWKGRPYIRSRVTPANPQSVDQTTQRNYMTKIVGWWHDLQATIKATCDDLGEADGISGFNAFVKRNVKDLADSVDPRIIPLSEPTNPVTTCAGGAGSGSGEIDVTWDQAQAATGNAVIAIVEPTATPAGQSDIAVGSWNEAVDAEDEAGIITGLTPATEYDIWLLVQDAVTSHYSIAAHGVATSQT